MNALTNLLNEHLYQFIITLVILLAYVVTNYAGRPTSTLESITLVIVAYWFATSQTRTTNSLVGDKIDKLENKISTQEALRTKNNA